MKKYIRKLDNVAKLFSLDDKKNKNLFRYQILLKEKINHKILKKSIDKTLEYYKSFKVKLSNGIFWNHFEKNDKEIVLKYETNEDINIDNNNDYLFKITYSNKKINLDIFHVLTDGVGAINFLKSIIYNYLNIKHNLSYYKNDESLNINDEYINNNDNNYNEKFNLKKAYLLPQKIIKNNNTNYILRLNEIKQICKKYNVTITEYFTTLYIYSMYLSLYNKKVKKK